MWIIITHLHSSLLCTCSWKIIYAMLILHWKRLIYFKTGFYENVKQGSEMLTNQAFIKSVVPMIFTSVKIGGCKLSTQQWPDRNWFVLYQSLKSAKVPFRLTVDWMWYVNILYCLIYVFYFKLILMYWLVM